MMVAKVMMAFMKGDDDDVAFASPSSPLLSLPLPCAARLSSTRWSNFVTIVSTIDNFNRFMITHNLTCWTLRITILNTSIRTRTNFLETNPTIIILPRKLVKTPNLTFWTIMPIINRIPTRTFAFLSIQGGCCGTSV